MRVYVCKHIIRARIHVRECVTYSVCDHFHPNKLVLGSLNVITVKPQIYKPVVHTHTHTKVPVSYEGVQQSKNLHSAGSGQEFPQCL